MRSSPYPPHAGTPRDQQAAYSLPAFERAFAQASLAERTAQAERRRGLLGAWLDLVAPSAAPPDAPLAERERVRRAELSGYVLLGVLFVGLALVPNGLANFPTLVSSAIIIASAVVAGMLNRTDHTTSAALVLIAAFTLALGGALVWAPELDLMWMPALDFFAVPVLLAALLLPRQVPFIVGTVNIGIVTALLVLKPRDPALAQMAASLGIYHFVIRPAMLIVIVAIASWLWSRSVEQAIARADRAEEIAAAEHQLAAQKVQLERGIQGLLETHVRIANGDFSARAPVGQDNVLWQIAVSLNNLVGRLGKWAQVDQRLQHTEIEIDRLASAVEHAQHGQRPLWPALGGTRVDRLTLLLASGAPARGQRMVAPAQSAQRAAFSGDPRQSAITASHRAATRASSRAPSDGPLVGRWREPSIQHMASQMAPRPHAPLPPFGVPVAPPTAHRGQSPLAGASQERGGVWPAAADRPTRQAGYQRYNPPAATFPHLELSRSDPSPRPPAHAYQQPPMPDWLSAHLPSLSETPQRGAAQPASTAETTLTPGSVIALGQPDQRAEQGSEESGRHDDPALASAGTTYAQARSEGNHAGALADGVALQGSDEPRGVQPDSLPDWPAAETDGEANPQHPDGGVDWPGFLRQVAEEPH